MLYRTIDIPSRATVASSEPSPVAVIATWRLATGVAKILAGAYSRVASYMHRLPSAPEETSWSPELRKSCKKAMGKGFANKILDHGGFSTET